MRIPLKQGREFTTADTETSPRTVVINESFARQYFLVRIRSASGSSRD